MVTWRTGPGLRGRENERSPGWDLANNLKTYYLAGWIRSRPPCSWPIWYSSSRSAILPKLIIFPVTLGLEWLLAGRVAGNIQGMLTVIVRHSQGADEWRRAAGYVEGRDVPPRTSGGWCFIERKSDDSLDVKQFEKQILLRQIRLEDYDQLVQLQLKCFPGMKPGSVSS